MADNTAQVLEYLAHKKVPEKFVGPEVPDGGLRLETIELVGTLQAGNAQEIHVLSGGVVLRLPTEAVLAIDDSKFGPTGSARMVVSTTAVAEARHRLLLLPEIRDNTPLPVLETSGEHIDYGIYTDKTLERYKDVIEKLRQMALSVPVGAGSNSETVSFASSATGDGNGNSDSDPIRMTDD
ncbi:hypothetical protein Cme02nite_51440 [Catellatospora methionotrophica]|uniref:Uncharacterized protein n=1 Tax=Catellatospora methionotrophica TaxID=121620 RepID=A0A8J3L9E7_9ACTN|nr:hypothetical protein [Catellatospora methionotrophica]GIG16812.1 hypothetical protein Cme02nite_51440 [Catellatospora methionotrophica]